MSINGHFHGKLRETHEFRGTKCSDPIQFHVTMRVSDSPTEVCGCKAMITATPRPADQAASWQQTKHPQEPSDLQLSDLGQPGSNLHLMESAGKCWKVTPPYQPKIGGAAGGGGAGGEAPGASSNEWECGNVPVQSDVLGKICRKLWFYMVLQLYPRNSIK